LKTTKVEVGTNPDRDKYRPPR